MNIEASHFLLATVPGFLEMEGQRQVDHIAYYLTAIREQESFSASDVIAVFKQLDLKPYSRTAPYISENSSQTNGRYIRASKGYRLERRTFEDIRRVLDQEPKQIELSRRLAELLDGVRDP